LTVEKNFHRCGRHDQMLGKRKGNGTCPKMTRLQNPQPPRAQTASTNNPAIKLGGWWHWGSSGTIRGTKERDRGPKRMQRRRVFTKKKTQKKGDKVVGNTTALPPFGYGEREGLRKAPAENNRKFCATWPGVGGEHRKEGLVQKIRRGKVKK